LTLVLRFLLFAAYLPLLLPPGFCPCKAAAFVHELVAGHDCRQSDVPAEHDDESCCHCKAGVSHAPRVTPPTTVPADLTPGELVAARHVFPRPRGPSVVPPPAHFPYTPPLYLRHCALVL
jgi:hypothetical protein